MKVLLFLALCALVATSSASVSNLAGIAGYWGSVQGGSGNNYPQRFACTASPTSRVVTCTGVDVPGATYPIQAPQAIDPIIALGQRISVRGVSAAPQLGSWISQEQMEGPISWWQYNANTIVNFLPTDEIPRRIPSDLSAYFVWKLIAK